MRSIALIALVGCASSPPAPVPSGSHRAYSFDHLYLPTNNTEARAYALDLNGDHALDNQLGSVLATISSMGVDSEKATTAAIDAGQIALVADLQTPSFTNARAAGFTIVFGEPQTDGSYAITSDSPLDEPLVGPAVDGNFQVGPGELSIRFAFVDPSLLITMTLDFARVELDGVSEDGIASGVIVGGVGQTSLDTGFLPAARQGLQLIVARDCGTQNTRKCGCLQGSLGEVLISEYDTAPADCTISLPELENGELTQELLVPDLSFGGKPYMSFGAGFSAVATRLD